MNNHNKTIIMYYSAQNHTRSVATKIAANLNADIFEIEPAEPYTENDLSWTDSNSRVSREHDNESLQDVALKNITVPNWDSYDTVLIGYPIWWGLSAWPVDSFVDQIHKTPMMEKIATLRDKYHLHMKVEKFFSVSFQQSQS